MNFDLFRRGLRRVVRLDLLAVLCFLSCSISGFSTELIVRWSQGGPNQYTGVFAPVAIGFTLDEPTRIERVQTWIWRDGPVKASLLLNDLSTELYSETFTSERPPSTPVGTPAIPAQWQGAGSLKWDLEPGDYYLSFDEGFFPLGYPVTTPNPPGVQIPWDYALLTDEGWENSSLPVGVEIYGSQLSAVPEPATYGLLGSMLLLGLATFRRRGRAKVAQ